MKNTACLPRRALYAAMALAFTTPAFAVDFHWAGGVYVSNVTSPNPLALGDVLQIDAGSNKFFNGVGFASAAGSIVFWNADNLFLQNGASILNDSAWHAHSDDELRNNGGTLSSFTNRAMFRKAGGLGNTTIGSIAFVNDGGTLRADMGTLLFSGGNATFQGNSVFEGDGVVAVSNDATFNGAFTSSNLELRDGTLTGNGAVVNGAVSFTGGTLTGGWTVAGGATLSGRGAANKFLSGATVTNNGTTSWETGSTLFMMNGALFDNRGGFTFSTGATLQNNGGALPRFTNSGTLSVAAGESATVGSVQFVNDAGVLHAGAGATLTFSGGNATFNTGTQFTGAGQVKIANNAAFSGALSSQNLLFQTGVYTGNAALIGGTAGFTGGAFTGDWELASGGVLTVGTGGNKFLNAGDFINRGTVAWTSANDFFLQNGAIFDNQGTFAISGAVTLVNNSPAGVTPEFRNAGLLNVTANASVGSIRFQNNGGTINVGTGATLTFNGGNATFNAGTQFTGAGVVAFQNSAAFNGLFGSANVDLNAGTFTGGAAVINGNVDFTGGTLAGSWTLPAGHSLTAKTGGNKFLSAATLTNEGAINWQTGNSFFLMNGATLDNPGTFAIANGMAIVDNGGTLPRFFNSGTLSVAGGQSAAVGSVQFVNNGGVLDAAAGATLTFNGGNATFNAGTQFTGAGLARISNNAVFNGGFSSTNLSLQAGTFTGAGAVLSGGAEMTGGTLTGSWTVGEGAMLAGRAGTNKFLSAGTLTNRGTLAWQTTNNLFVMNGSHIANQGTMLLQADTIINYNGGTIGSFVNTGLIQKTGGVGTAVIDDNLGFSNLGVVDVRNGTLRLPTNFANAGTLKGTGSFQTNLTNNAHVAPGASPGTLTISGNYVQSGTGFLDIELASSTLFDRLVVTGTASLGGTLALSCVMGCAIQDGDEFIILDSVGNLTGTFANITTTGFGTGFDFDIFYDQANDWVMLAVNDAGVNPIPEPETYALMLAGLGLLGFVARRRRMLA